MTQQTWHVLVSFTGHIEEGIAFDVMDRLGEYGAAMSVAQDLSGGAIRLTMTSDSAANAALDAIDLVRDDLTANQVEHSITGVAVQNPDAFQAEMDAPAFPQVVGYAEIAELAGVSRQRARQFADIPGFPEPVIVTAQGPLMAKTAVTRWLSHRHTRRPAKTG